MSLVVPNRVVGVSSIKDKICDVIYHRNEKILSPLALLDLFSSNLSVRQRSLIQDINALFDALSRLNLGSIHNLWAFTKISEYLKDPELGKLIADVAQLDIPDENQCAIGRNLYAYRRNNRLKPAFVGKNIDDDPPGQSAPAGPSKLYTQSGSSSEKRLQFVIFDVMAKELGKRWRDLGRVLEFHEAELDEFEEHNGRDLRARIHEMMNVYSKRFNSTEEMIKDLCTALEQARRVDLRKKVQQVVAKQM